MRRSHSPATRWSALLFALSSALAGCPSREQPADVPAAIDAPTRPDVIARGRRRRRSRVRAAQHAARGPSEPTALTEDESVGAPRPRTNPESGPTLPEDLGPPPATSFDMTQGASGPMGLEPAQISRAMNPLMARFGACAEFATRDDGSGPRGRVSVRLRIRNDGRPIAARVSGGGGGPEFVLCVRRVVAAARFDRFEGPDVFANWGFDVDG